jgi:hypothetical protein
MKAAGAQNVIPNKRVSVREETGHQQTRSSARFSARHRSRRSGKKNIMDEKTRKVLIENDFWAGEVTAISVGCRGCGKTVSLDKRSMYYPGLSIKHRGKCSVIRRLEGRVEKRKPKVTTSFKHTRSA